MSTHYIFLVVIALGVGACDSEQRPNEEAGDSDDRVVFRSKDGDVLTTDDLKDADGTFNYEIVGSTEIPEQANRLHQEARQYGASGNYEEALKRLAESHTLAPSWPYPPYDTAFTYLLMKDFAKAREFYAKTVELSPRGFFTAITALDTLNREASGDLPEGTYAAYVSLEWINDPSQKSQLVRALVEKFPGFAPAWKEYALICEDPAEKLQAIEKGLASEPDNETKGILLINKALTIHEGGDETTAIEILGEVALDSESTFANEHLAKQSLAMISD